MVGCLFEGLPARRGGRGREGQGPAPAPRRAGPGLEPGDGRADQPISGPEFRRDETRQVPCVRRRNDHIHPAQGCSLRGQDDVAVKRGVGCGGGSALLTSLGPERRRLAHRRCRDRQILDLGDECIEPRDTRGPAGSEQLSPDLVIGDFGNHHHRATGRRVQKPPATGGSLLRSAGVRGQAERTAVEHDDPAHQILPFNYPGKSLRSDKRPSSRAWTRYSIVSRCSPAPSSSIQDRIRAPRPSARSSGDPPSCAISASSRLVR